jgi:3-hydroxyacyl-[acyl-carrier-protein] dehydratase
MVAPLVDLTTIDLSRPVLDEDELRSLLPHREEFQMVDAIVHLDPVKGVVVGVKEWSAEPWWARGHVPGRPLLPGVLMVEGAAQTASVLIKKAGGWPAERFIGLAGLEGVRFRGAVVPPARIHYVASSLSVSTRMARVPAQCLLGARIVMEMELLGVPL